MTHQFDISIELLPTVSELGSAQPQLVV